MKADGDIRIRAGFLRHPIQINQQSTGPGYDAAGPVESWSPFATNVMAQIGPARATDRIQNGQTTTETIIPITIRYLPGVLPNMQVVALSSGAVYIIQGIINMDERNVVMELECLSLGNQT
jgi:head-tail adaptor